MNASHAAIPSPRPHRRCRPARCCACRCHAGHRARTSLTTSLATINPRQANNRCHLCGNARSLPDARAAVASSGS